MYCINFLITKSKMKIKITALLIFIPIVFWNYSLLAQSDSAFQYKREWEVFPILNYDSDAGFGYGGKGFFYNFLNGNESFDLTLYNSTKGERWYRFVFSMVDIQRRQGKIYPLALDIIADYDKWVNSKYYLTVNDSSSNSAKDEIKTYKKEVLEITALLSKGFVRDFVAEFGLRFKDYNGFGFNPSEDLSGNNSYHIEDVSQHIQTASLLLNFRWDTRTNFINPQKGIVLEVDNEIAHDILNPPAQNYFKISFLFESYVNVFKPNFLIANRLLLQSITDDTNYLLLIPLGGNSSLRGMPQDRYMNSSATLINSEFRFPILWRLGGIVGVDIGNGNELPEWIFNPVTGLRFYMDNFVVRFDVGFGKETTGYYFNFGQLF